MSERITDEIIKKAIEEADKTMREGKGGPFGAAVITADGKIYYGSNHVLSAHDPTAHAEIWTIRKACKELGTHDLKGCILYTTCMPCPMYLSAIIWSNIKEIWYSSTAEDAAKIGFRDADIYEYLKGTGKQDIIKVSRIAPKDALILFQDYARLSGTIY